MEHVRTFGTVITYGGFAVAGLGVLSLFGGSSSGVDDGPFGLTGFGIAGLGMAAFMAGMFLSDAGKTGKDFKQERKAGKTTCYACGTKRRLEASCPKCGAPPSSSV